LGRRPLSEIDWIHVPAETADNASQEEFRFQGGQNDSCHGINQQPRTAVVVAIQPRRWPAGLDYEKDKEEIELNILNVFIPVGQFDRPRNLKVVLPR
jgi:hypothetical protein